MNKAIFLCGDLLDAVIILHLVIEEALLLEF